MTNKQAYLAIIALTLLVSVCFVPLVLGVASSASPQSTNPISPLQTSDPVFENISVSLSTPVFNDTIVNDFNVSFTYVPSINGSDKFYGASLIVNGSIVATNQTALTAYQNNTISYIFSSNGTSNWNIRLENSTNSVFAPSDYNVTLAVAPPNSIAVALKAPDNGTTVKNDFNCSFIFVPTLSGTDKFYSAALVVNGTSYGGNQTVISNGVNNTIYYKFTANGTYNWNIRLQNSTHTVTAPSNYNFTVAVYVAPEPTPTPVATPTPTPSPIPATPTATPTPTPAPDNSSLTTWAIVIIIVFVISAVLAIVLILLRRRHP
jgi:hypothetical protein